jgi:hypothetical protein
MASAVDASGDLYRALDFAGYLVRQGDETDRGAGMAPGLTEDLDEQIGAATDGLRLLREIGGTVAHAAHHDDAHDAVEAA